MSSLVMFGWLLLLASFPEQLAAQAQKGAMPLNPDDPRLTYMFSIQPGREPLRFKVDVDTTGTVTGVQVFRSEAIASPFQRLAGCSKYPDQWSEPMSDPDFALLLKHADLNFDGFEDLELIQNYNSHLGKGIYCIYLWDEKSGLFRYSPETTKVLAVNPEAHPDTRTVTVHEDWQGGSWRESTYRWQGNKLELIEQSSLTGDWSEQKDGRCGYTFSCSRLVGGKMVDTLSKPICSPDEMSELPDCPAAEASSALGIPQKPPSPHPR